MADFTWSERAGRFRDAGGRFVPESKVRDGVDVVCAQASDRASALARDLVDGNISIDAYRDGLFRVIKDVHIASALAAYGGKNAMTPERYGYTGHLIKQQYQYARGMLSDIVSGRQPLDGRLVARAAMYGQAGRQTYTNVKHREEERRGKQEVRNILGVAEHCDECTAATDRGWTDLDKMSLPGSRVCRTNCKCRLEYRGRAA